MQATDLDVVQNDRAYEQDQCGNPDGRVDIREVVLRERDTSQVVERSQTHANPSCSAFRQRLWAEHSKPLG